MKDLFTKKLLIKIAIITVFCIILNSIELSISPIISNSLALNQMNNTDDSYLWFQMYNYLSKYLWLIKLLLIIIFFGGDFKKLFNILRSKKSNEKN